jgi:hypothetical protein
VTLLLKDQAVVLLPVLLAAVLYARILGAPTRSYPEGYAALARRACFECAGLRRQRHLAIYVGAITAMTVVELVVRRVFVPEAEAPALDWGALHSVLRELKYTIALGGQEHLGAYVALAGAAVIVVLVAPGLAQARPAVTRLWLLATFAAFSTISSALFALIVSRSDLVFFPLWFYALFLCAAVAIVLRLVWPLRRLRAVSLAVLVLLIVLSGLASVRGGSAIQHSMGPRSELTLTFDYDFVYGRYARAATIPSRRAEMVKRVLRGVQVPGPVVGNDVRSLLLGRGRGSYPDVVRRDPNGFFSDDGH